MELEHKEYSHWCILHKLGYKAIITNKTGYLCLALAELRVNTDKIYLVYFNQEGIQEDACVPTAETQNHLLYTKLP